MVESTNKTPTEMHTFLPRDEALTTKYKVQVVAKDPEVAVPLTDHKSFNPFTERKVDNPTTDCDTLTHLLKAALGTGTLAMPYAFKSSGLIGGIIGTIFASLICTHCSYILVKCAHVLYHRSHRTKLGFADIAENAFATGPKWGRKFSKSSRYTIQICLLITYFGTCSAYACIIAENFGQVIKYYMDSSLGDVDDITLSDNFMRVLIAGLFIPLTLLVYVPDLKYLAPFSMVANLFMGCGIAITFYYLVIDLPPVTSELMYRPLTDFPQFFGVTIFAMEAIGVIMPLENNMKTPQHFVGICGVLNRGMSFVTLIYILLGFLGFVKYGSAVKAVVTSNLSIKLIPAQVVKVLIGLAVFFTFGLQFYVCIDIGWAMLKERFPKKPRLAQYAMRTAMVTICVTLAIAIPKIGPLVELVGAFCFSLLGLVAPVIIEMVTYSNVGYGRFNWMIYKNIIVGALGLMAMILGTMSAISSIKKEMFSY